MKRLVVYGLIILGTANRKGFFRKVVSFDLMSLKSVLSYSTIISLIIWIVCIIGRYIKGLIHRSIAFFWGFKQKSLLGKRLA